MKNDINPENTFSSADSFEMLLNEKLVLEKKIQEQEKEEENKPIYSKAIGNVNFDGFITMVKNITTKVLKKYNVNENGYTPRPNCTPTACVVCFYCIRKPGMRVRG